jgi:hypothetical protein
MRRGDAFGNKLTKFTKHGTGTWFRIGTMFLL